MFTFNRIIIFITISGSCCEINVYMSTIIYVLIYIQIAFSK